MFSEPNVSACTLQEGGMTSTLKRIQAITNGSMMRELAYHFSRLRTHHLLAVQTTIDVHRRPGHEGRQIGSQVSAGATNFFRLGQTLHWHGVDDALQHFRFDCHNHLGGNVARADDVNRHALGSQFGSCLLYTSPSPRD